jgi:hypothetical protein
LDGGAGDGGADLAAEEPVVRRAALRDCPPFELLRLAPFALL